MSADLKERLWGVLAIILAIWLFYESTAKPIGAARQGAANVEISNMQLAMTPLLLAVGVSLLAFGEKGLKWANSDAVCNGTIGKVILGVGLAVVLGYVATVHWVLHANGFRRPTAEEMLKGELEERRNQASSSSAAPLPSADAK